MLAHKLDFIISQVEKSEERTGPNEQEGVDDALANKCPSSLLEVLGKSVTF